MKFLVDNNLPPVWAPALTILSANQRPPIRVESIRNKYGANAKDHEWIPKLDAEGGWCVLSQDRFGKGDLEREALRQSNLIVFRLSAQWSKQPYWAKTQALLRWWPAILEQSQRYNGRTLLEVSFTFRAPGKFTVVQKI